MSRLSQFSLRVQDRDIPLPYGPFHIGRHRACDLVIEEGTVSRRHAVLHVRPDELVVEDLGSHNGVRVNGIPVAGPRPVEHGMRIGIGSNEIVVLERSRLRSERRRTQPQLPRRDRAITVELGSADDAETQSAGFDARALYDVLAASCERALEEGRMADLAAAARNLRATISDGQVASQPLRDETLARLLRLSLDVIQKTGELEWLATVFDVFASCERVPDGESLPRLLSAIEATSFAKNRSFVSYVAAMRLRVDSLSDQERARFDRLCLAAGV